MPQNSRHHKSPEEDYDSSCESNILKPPPANAQTFAREFYAETSLPRQELLHPRPTLRYLDKENPQPTIHKLKPPQPQSASDKRRAPADRTPRLTEDRYWTAFRMQATPDSQLDRTRAMQSRRG